MMTDVQCMFRHSAITAVVFAATSLFTVQAALGDSIQLRRAIRMPENRSQVLLSDIAELEGDAAVALRDVLIVEITDPTSLQTIRFDDLRETLERVGAHWGTLNLSGGDVLLRPRATGAEFTPQAMQSASVAPQRAVAPAASVPREYRENTLPAVGVMYERSLRAAVAQRFIHALQVDPVDLRLIVDLRDEELLAASLDEHRFEIQPTSGFDSERVALLVRRWEDGRVAEERSLSIQPLVRARLAVVQRDLRRGEPVGEQDVVEREQWVPPPAARLHAPRDDFIGKVASRAIRAGEPLRSRDFQSEAVIRRGDRVTVRCVSGSGILITLAAEARADGAAGEEIAFRKLGERDTFLAVVVGPGEAIIDLSQ